MKTANLKRLGAELDTIVRVSNDPDLTEDRLLNEVIGWLDYTYHGVVPLPFDPPGGQLPDNLQPEGRGLEE